MNPGEPSRLVAAVAAGALISGLIGSHMLYPATSPALKEVLAI